MKNGKNVNEMGASELIDLFGDDIIFKRGHIDTRIERSKAGKELVRRGKLALADIAGYLKRLKFRPDCEVAYAWRHLLEEIQTVHGLSRVPKEHYMLLDKWIEWAESMTPTPSKQTELHAAP